MNANFPELTKKEFEALVAFHNDEDVVEDGLDTIIWAALFIKDCGISRTAARKALAGLVEKGMVLWTNPDKRWKAGDNDNATLALTDLGKDWMEAYDAGEIEAPKKKRAQTKAREQIEYNGKSQCICAWARELGLNYGTLYDRIHKLEWPIEKAFETPCGRSKKAEAEE